ncbi:MAG: hypothetical protein ACRDO7_08205 [Nocardioidaceae bacterium]
MSGIVRPKGRAPAGIYWRRRLLLVAVVLLATAGAVKVLGGSGDDSGAVASSSAPEPETGGTGDADAKSDDDSNAKRAPKPDRDDTSTVRSGERDVTVRMPQGASCDPASVSVRPSVRPDAHAGGPVTIRLGLSTDEDTSCVLSLAEQTPLISIAADGELVWMSERCDDLVQVDSVRLEPNWLTYVDARWSGRSSRQTCGENADFAASGEYTVQAALLGGEPTKSTISLAQKPEEKPDKDSDKDSDQDSDKNDPDEAKPGEDSGEQGNDAGGDSDDGGTGDGPDTQDKPDAQDAEGGADEQGADADRG